MLKYTPMRFLFLCLCAFPIQNIFGQLIISGRVVNAKNKEAIPFVNISVAKSKRGTTTDVEGRFQLMGSTVDTLVFSSIGFVARRVAASNLAGQFHEVELNENTIELNEVVVLAGENPAWKIMRQVIANRKVNDPEALSSFSYNSYTKLFADMVPAKNLPLVTDTSKSRKFYDKTHLVLFESYTKRYFKRPNLSKEIVLGNQVPGIRDPFISVVATDLQSFSFYSDHINLLDKPFVNPASKGFENRYELVLEETILHEQDSVFIISFRPFDGKNFNGLKGQFHISSDGYAFKNVIAGPDDERAIIDVSIHQAYEKRDGHWFPVQLNSALYFNEYGRGQLRLKYTGRSYLTNIEIEKEIDRKIFGTLNVEMDPQANHREPTFWDANRTDSLSKKDRNTFRLYETLKPKQLNALNGVFGFMEALVTNKIKAGKIFIPLPDLLRINGYEKARIGFGMETGRAMSRYFSLNGYGGYGFSDQALKYGAGIRFNLSQRRETFLKLNWKRDVAEPGAAQILKSPIVGSEIYRTWATSRMDSVETVKLELSLRPIAFSEVSLSLKHEERNPTYRYQYQHEAGPDSTFTVAEAVLMLRYAFGEQFTQIRDSRIVTELKYPQLFLTVSKSASGILGGEYGFNKLEVKINHRLRMRGLGTTTVSLQGGAASGNIPYPYLFNGRGSYIKQSLASNVLVPHYFQTMGLYEFVSDRYAYLFLDHSFGRLTGTKSKIFRPELSIHHNMGVGQLGASEKHRGLIFNTLEKGFVESGLVINHIVRFKYLNLFYFGLGGGVFYRYGPNTLARRADNFAWKFSASWSF
jgi:Family of unknown function (DUF5686)/CarboxypepD_reg-like domain